MPEYKFENKISYRGEGLFRAAKENRSDIARALLDQGAEVDARDEDGMTSLYWVASNNSLDMARLLIDHGANTDGIDLSWMDDQEDA